MMPHLHIAVSGALCMMLCAAHAAPVTLHVSTDGDDENPGTAAAPLATLHRARDLLRERRQEAGLPEGATVVVREGTYQFAEPLVFRSEDSGTEEGRIVYRAAAGARVTLTGGRTVSGWQPYRDGIRRADLADMDLGRERFWQLFYRGERQTPARYPNRDPEHPRSGGLLYAGPPVEAESKTLLRYNPERLDPTRWEDPTQLRVHVWPWLNWNRDVIPVEAIDAENNVIVLARPARYRFIEGNRFYLDNIPEELNQPGEWYFDDAARVLYFMPPDGEDPGDGVTVPVLRSLVQFLGEAGGEPVRHIELRGFTLAETHRHLVEMRGAEHCTIAACVLTHCDDTAVSLSDGSSHNRIIGCDIAHVGGNGVLISGTRDWEHRWEGQPSHNLISNNHIHNVGEDGHALGGVVINPVGGGNATHDNVISHNLIHDTPRRGINFQGSRNVVEFNHIHHTNLETADTGAIGMCCRDFNQTGNVIRHNLIHDSGGYNMLRPGEWAFPHYCWGIYLDDYTSGVHVYGNIVVGAHRGGVHVHGGENNVIENNIIVDSAAWQVEYNPRDRPARREGDRDFPPYIMTGTRLVRNIFSYDGQQAPWLRGRLWEQILAGSDHNLIWPGDGPVRINDRSAGDMDLDAWRELGFDRNSVAADPLFVDAANGDYRLRPDSPALALGFRPIPVERIGPYESEDRATWPLPAPGDVWREQPLLFPEGEPGPRTEVPDVPQVVAQRVEPPPVIDGNVAPPQWAWEGPGVVEVAALAGTGARGTHPSRAMVAWDDEALYVAFINEVSDTAGLVRDGGTWVQDDGVEVCVQDISGDAPGPIFILRGFPSGAFETTVSTGGRTPATRRLAEALSYAAAIGEGEWAAEWRIPFAALGVDPRQTRRLLFNMGARKAAREEWISWVSTGGATWRLDRAGVLVLGNYSPCLRLNTSCRYGENGDSPNDHGKLGTVPIFALRP